MELLLNVYASQKVMITCCCPSLSHMNPSPLNNTAHPKRFVMTWICLRKDVPRKLS